MALKIDQELVQHVAGLAYLDLTPDEARYYEEQLKKVLDYVGMLDAMPDELGKDWRGDVLAPATLERRDEMVPSLDPEVALAGAPQKIGTAFQVPRIIE